MPNRAPWGHLELDGRAADRAALRNGAGTSDQRTDPHHSLTELSSIVGRKWHLVIIYELVTAPRGFGALKTRIDGISSKVLTNHLRDLEEKGLVERAVVSDRPFRVEYSLTERGESFRGLIDPVLEGRVALR